MTGFAGSPRVTRGALIGFDPINPLASVIVFQYNPDQVTRRLTARAADPGGAQSEQMRLKGPPEETLSFDIEIDAVDQLEQGNGSSEQFGIAPALASLELMLYPKSALVIANQVLASLGLIEVIPPTAPLAVLVWGSRRVLPVRLTDFSITEQAFDPNLNPIQGKVSLGLRVLNYDDLGLLSPGGALFMSHQIAKEVMATVNSVSALGSFSATASFQVGG
ncbi:MAG TPA: hypothetical protein VIC62_17100 [Nakamurella sp.]|jgi:hypothetical protein